MQVMLNPLEREGKAVDGSFKLLRFWMVIVCERTERITALTSG